MSMYGGILLSCLGWCPQLLLGVVRQATKANSNMEDCWSFTCCFSGTLGSLSKCGQLKSFLQLGIWYFGSCSSELDQLVPLPFSQGRFYGILVILIELHDFCSSCGSSLVSLEVFPSTNLVDRADNCYTIHHSIFYSVTIPRCYNE